MYKYSEAEEEDRAAELSRSIQCEAPPPSSCGCYAQRPPDPNTPNKEMRSGYRYNAA